MTIGKKISLACGVLVALTVLLGSIAILNIGRVDSNIRTILTGPFPGIYSLGRLEQNAKEQKEAMFEHILSQNTERMSQLEIKLDELQSGFETESREYEKTLQTAAGREQFARLLALQAANLRVWQKVKLLSRAARSKDALLVWNTEAVDLQRQRATLFQEMLAYRKQSGDESGRAAQATGDSARFWSISILLAAVVSGSLLAYFVVRGINRVLTQAVNELSEGAEQVTSAAGEVSGSSQSLAQGASEQAASLEETSASSEEMSSMTRKNAENSAQAAEYMRAVSERVADANRTLADMTLSMQEIGASSGKISKIIRVIDEIAFQTNILALNAAVEAARAGEAGMGFAVVADEVRNLAQRSAQAAKDTASLIEDSIAKSGEGSDKLGEVASSILAITEGASKAMTLVDEVQASSKEQAQGIAQIFKAVAQMDRVTQTTAANAEESASASEQLNAQSQALMAVVVQLQTLVGSTGTSGVSRAVAGRRSVPVLAGARRGAEFRLGDSEFSEF